MGTHRRIAIKVFQGPSLLAPFAAVVAEFESPFRALLPSHQIRRLLGELLPSPLELQIELTDDAVDFVQLAALLARGWQDFRGPNELPINIRRSPNGLCQILIGFHDADASAAALRGGIELAHAVFARGSGSAVDNSTLASFLQNAASLATTRQPDYIARALIRAARLRRIPVYPISPGSSVWMYGQGARGIHFIEAANDRNSLTGQRLVRNKASSNQLIRRLGFPGVEHGVAANAGAALQIARAIGFPLVVKPAGGSGGKGVTVGVMTENELDSAFAKANPFSRGQVLVERFVAGDDHRLSVFGGKLMRASRFSLPHVTGDGRHTVRELIETENESRSEDASTVGDYLVRLATDNEAVAVLRKQGYGLDDRPPAGLKLFLRRTANLKTGGRLDDLTSDVHPDNIAMAESIARNFRLDAAGIDFITPDIGASWRDVECAVIEVNAVPGIGDYLAEKILADKFPSGSDGRIPSVLLIGLDTRFADRLVQRIQELGKCAGQTDSSITRLGGIERFKKGADLPARIMSLLLDQACGVLVISATAREVVEYGLPHTRFNVALIGSVPIADDVRQLVRNNCIQLVEDVTDDAFEEVILRHIVPALS